MKTKKGFTLVELLVVISIIALLMSILMPALSKARKQAQQVVCLSNLRQNALTIMTYSSDNDDSFTRGHSGTANPDSNPGYGYWMADLKPYRGNDIKSLICPSAKKVNPNYNPSVPSNYTGWTTYSAAWGWEMNGMPDVTLDNPIPSSYTMNVWATNPESGSPIDTREMSYSGIPAPKKNFWRRISNVRRPSNVPIFGDGRWLEAFPSSQFMSALAAPPTESQAELLAGSPLFVWGIGQFCMPRHTPGTNMVFADFSTHKIKLTELWEFKWNRNFDTGNMFAKNHSMLPDWIK